MVEVVGKDSQRIADIAQVGSYATIVGYIRSEQFKGQERMKVRTLSIDIWGTDGAKKAEFRVDEGEESSDDPVRLG